MGLESTANLLVAGLELSAVRLVSGAIRTADPSSGRGASATPLGPDPNPPFGGSGRFRMHAEPVYEPRPHIHPVPRYEDREVYYSVRHEARPEQAANDAAAACPFPYDAAEPATTACSMEGLIPPVWKTLPPVEHPAPLRRVVTITRHRNEPRRPGLVVDVHV